MILAIYLFSVEISLNQESMFIFLIMNNFIHVLRLSLQEEFGEEHDGGEDGDGGKLGERLGRAVAVGACAGVDA